MLSHSTCDYKHYCLGFFIHNTPYILFLTFTGGNLLGVGHTAGMKRAKRKGGNPSSLFLFVEFEKINQKCGEYVLLDKYGSHNQKRYKPKTQTECFKHGILLCFEMREFIKKCHSIKPWCI